MQFNYFSFVCFFDRKSAEGVFFPDFSVSVCHLPLCCSTLLGAVSVKKSRIPGGVKRNCFWDVSETLLGTYGWITLSKMAAINWNASEPCPLRFILILSYPYMFHNVNSIVTHHILWKVPHTNDCFHWDYSNCRGFIPGTKDVFILDEIILISVEILHKLMKDDVKFIIHQLLFEVKRWAAANNYTKHYFVFH